MSAAALPFGPGHQELEQAGFCRLPALLDPAEVERYRAMALQLVAAQTEEQRKERWSPGSLLSLWRDVGFVDLIASPRLFAALRAVGLRDPRFSNAYVVSKPPRSPRMFWHQDWWGWDDPVSYTAAVQQVGLLLYLDDAGAQNGCLRLLPGSHRHRHRLHLPCSEERRRELRRGLDLDAPEFADDAAAVDVPVRAGDGVLVDARLLHATRDNRSDRPRTGLVLWYLADQRSMPAPLRARIGGVAVPADWPAAARQRVLAVGTSVEGSVVAGAFTHHPDERLR